MRALGVVAGLLLVPACVVPEPIEGRAGGVVFPSGRVEFALAERQLPAVPGDGEVAAETEGIVPSIALSATAAEGRFEISHRDFDDADFEMVAGSALLVGRVRSGEFEAGIYAGMGADRVRLEFTGVRPFERDKTHLALVLGIEGAWVIEDTGLRLFARLEPWLEFPAASSAFFEAGLGYDVLEPLRLVAAYRFWAYGEDSVSTPLGNYELDLGAHGIVLGGELRF
ncbi:MAG: hypothetical protein IT457_09380 [Planctomycetes bacterium]|nr:hypothetical protein [Planctomycetota bacterium]